MNCPRCKSEIPNDSKVCEVCGKKLQKKKLSSVFKEKKKKNKSADTLTKKDTKFKIILALSVTAVIVALVAVIIIFIDDNTGKNIVDDLKEFVGQPVKTAINETDVYFDDESAFETVNFNTDFDYIIEDDKDVEIDGVKFPKWAIFISADDNDKITSVKYVDFTVLKKNSKGAEVDKEINLNIFSMGDDYRTIAKAIDCDAFSVTYDGLSIIYEYRYYFENDFKDEQGMTLQVVFDNDNDFIYSTSQRIIPDYIE